MVQAIGWAAVVLAALVGLSNFYRSFVRGPLYRYVLRREEPDDFGAGLVGSVLQLVAIGCLWNTPIACYLILTLFVMDTGGLPWLVIMLLVRPDLFK